MLEQVASMFDDMGNLLLGLKKKTYEQRMKDFREKYGYYFSEMTDYVDAAEDKSEAVGIWADTFIEAVFQRFQVKGKVNGRVQTDLNLFMIYYVFPSILLTEHENATEIADVLCNKWGKKFKDSKIGYTTYDSIYSSFKESILGIPLRWK